MFVKTRAVPQTFKQSKRNTVDVTFLHLRTRSSESLKHFMPLKPANLNAGLSTLVGIVSYNGKQRIEKYCEQINRKGRLSNTRSNPRSNLTRPSVRTEAVKERPRRTVQLGGKRVSPRSHDNTLNQPPQRDIAIGILHSFPFNGLRRLNTT